MALLRWDDSPYWKKNQPKSDEEEATEAFIEPDLPKLTSPHTSKEITEAILDDPRYNAINPSNQQHIINIAIASAKSSGMLIDETELING